ncbi:MAG: exodeoxyribonuclease-1 [Parvicella sp.]|jgi:exodeoxyribonuclease-1
MATTLLWHDYETWGLNPRVDRAAQFAAIRTDEDLNIIGEPIELFCKPSRDFIPHPESMMITRLNPFDVDEKGLNEAAFFAAIHEAMSVPGTCSVGYNNLRFDDEVSRFGFYRNLIDPYSREWQNGNSRWDLVDLVRMTYALRPEGIVWPEREPGIPSFRLDQLSVANGIGHDNAHDALSDVHATIGLAKAIKQAQPKLYDYYFGFRAKTTATSMMNLISKDTLLHISGMYPSSIGCIAPVMPLATHPKNKNEYIVYDLRHDPERLINNSAQDIAKTLFTPNAELPEGVERIALKGIHINKSPALAPTNTLSDEQAAKWDIDWDIIEKHRKKLLKVCGLGMGIEKKVVQIYAEGRPNNKSDPDSALYEGFIDNGDRKICNDILAQSTEEKLVTKPPFKDKRLQTIYSRYLARNWPDQLDSEALQSWEEFCKARLLDGDHGCEFTLHDYIEKREQLDSAEIMAEDTEAKYQLLEELDRWIDEQLPIHN